MRRLINCCFALFVSACITTFSSCSKDEMINQPQLNNEEFCCSSLEWDESFHPNALTKSNSSDLMAVTSDNIFIGALYSSDALDSLSFNWISNPVEPISISYTFPGYYFDDIQRPSKSAMYKSLKNALASPDFSGKQSLAFEYDMRQFTKYSELKLAFGANINVASIFKLDASVNYTNISSTSGLFARVVQQNFSIIMDYPYDGNVLLNNDEFESIRSLSPVYINSIIFGRMAILAIESDYSYEELKTAVKIALSAKIVNGELNIDATTKDILQKATMRILVSGGEANQVVQIVEGYEAFMNFIKSGGEFSREVPGVPIFFTANYVEDNSVFRTTF